MPGSAELSEKLPDEIFQLVESFKKFVREQKAYRDQKFEVDTILEVGRETEEFTLAFQRVAVDSDRNSQLVQQIKDDTTKLLRHSELAYSLLRSHFANNPSIQQPQQPAYLSSINPSYLSKPTDQTTNTSSSQYFAELADQFESRMKAYGEQIKELKMSLDSITRAYNVDELFKWLKRQHETLGEIAAKIYMTHERIMERKSELDKFNSVHNNLRATFT